MLEYNKLITPVSVEPISLADVLSQIRYSTSDLPGSVSMEQSIAPGSHIIGDHEGGSSDVFGYSPLILLEAGECGISGTIDVIIEESDDNVNFSTWSSFTQVTESNDNVTFEKAYTGNKRYVRTTATVAIAACSFAVSVLLYAVSTSESTLIEDMITAAREYGEDHTGYAFAPQTWTKYLNDFPGVDFIDWKNGPLVSVTSIKYTDYLNDATTLTENTDFIVDADTFPGKIYLPYGKSWPSFTARPYNAVEITGVCGFTGTEEYSIPKNFKQAMLLHVGLMFRHRDEELPEKALETVNKLYRLRGRRII
jgi:uncharacterized phiE125 gp8 family phage protein